MTERPCPECIDRGARGLATIGNRRSRCRSCNRFIQAARSRTISLLAETFPAIHTSLTEKARNEVYAERFAGGDRDE